jgi:hypothetical protein
MKYPTEGHRNVDTYSIRAIERAVQVLACFSFQQNEHTIMGKPWKESSASPRLSETICGRWWRQSEQPFLLSVPTIKK